MKIIEALKELPLIEKKIQKNLSQIQTYSSNLNKGDDTDLPFKSEGEQQKVVDALLQSTRDLVKHKAQLRSQLAVTNAQVKVTIDTMTATIAEWIEYREGGLEKIIAAHNALNDNTAQNLLKTTPVDLQKGVRTLRFYDEAKRNEEIERLQDIKGKIDSSLEMVNATTDLVEAA